MALDIDWAAVRREFEETDRSLNDIAEQFGVNRTVVMKHARREQWSDSHRKPGPRTPDDGLTPKQRCFINEYLLDLNGTQAAIRAGYSERSAQSQADQNLLIPAVRQAVDAAIAERSKRTLINADRILQELTMMATANMADFAEWSEGAVRFKDSSKLTREQTAAVVEVSQGRDGLKIKFDKMAALNAAAKHIGVTVERHEISGPGGKPIEIKSDVTVNTKNFSMEELEILERLALKASGREDDSEGDVGA